MDPASTDAIVPSGDDEPRRRRLLEALATIELMIGGGMLLGAALAWLLGALPLRWLALWSPRAWLTGLAVIGLSWLVVLIGYLRWSRRPWRRPLGGAHLASGVLSLGLLVTLIGAPEWRPGPIWAACAGLLIVAGVALRSGTRRGEQLQRALLAAPALGLAIVVGLASGEGLEETVWALVLGLPFAVPLAMLAWTLGRRPRGVWPLIGLVLVVWGVLPALSGPALRRAKQRGAMKRTMASLRSVATAVESYAVDRGSYPAAGSLAELAPLLEPAHLEELPRLDGWGWPLTYHRTSDITYVVRSPGRDGEFDQADPTAYPEGPFALEEDHRDIVFSTGSFSRWPAMSMGF